MKKVICVLIILSIIAYPLFSMSVPSEPMRQEVPVNSGGDGQFEGFEILHPIVIVFTLVALSGVVMLVDNDEGNDYWGWAFVMPAVILGISFIDWN